MSEKNSNNQREVQAYDDKIKQSIRDLSAMKEVRKRTCNHRPNGKKQLEFVMNTKLNVPNKDKLSETTLICPRCEKVFDARRYSASEGDEAIYMFNNMIEQVKLNGNLTQEDLESIDNCYNALDTLASFAQYYNNMVDKLGNNDNNRKGRTSQSKGHIGVDSNMFGGRGY